MGRYNQAMEPERKPASDEVLSGPADPVREAAEYGIDIAMLRDNLALPIAERMRRYDIALATVEMLQKAKRL